uniref:Uncharacterized protein n=1 Tax=Anopheles albimanus TaxID=7167 RepID=A0A182FWM8_ANOAL
MLHFYDRATFGERTSSRPERETNKTKHLMRD